MSDDYTKEYIEDVAKGLGGKQPGEIAEELKKQLFIKEYIDEATEGMGGKQKSDVARELRTHILDSADALAAERKVPVSEQIVKEVLGKMGPAKKIAAMYPAREAIFEHGVGKALLSLAGIALAFLIVAGILWVVSPETLRMALPGAGPTQDVLQVILSVVSALAMAIVVIACIFIAMFIYNTRLKTPYEARLKSFERRLSDRTSMINVALRVGCTVFWLALLNLFWTKALFIQGFGNDPALIPLLTDKFAPFVLYFNVLGVLTILVALSYLLIRQKWIPSLLDAVMSLGNALLIVWVLAVFPFNPAFAPGPTTLIKFMLAVIIFGCLVATAKQLWDAMKFALYGGLDTKDAV
jgi:hypothetical protein